MTRSWGWSVGVAAVLSILSMTTAAAQLMSTCAQDSPERRGEIGCTVFQSKPLPEGLTAPVFWHIDRFDSADRARAAVGSTSIAFDAAGVWWLMTIERDTTDHHGGQHVTDVGPLPLPRAARYAMTVQSAMFMPGMYSLHIIIPVSKRSTCSRAKRATRHRVAPQSCRRGRHSFFRATR